MAIYNFHRILILAATAFFVILSAFGFTRVGRLKAATPPVDGESMNVYLIMGWAAAIAAVIGVVYFIYFNRKLARTQGAAEL